MQGWHRVCLREKSGARGAALFYGLKTHTLVHVWFSKSKNNNNTLPPPPTPRKKKKVKKMHPVKQTERRPASQRLGTRPDSWFPHRDRPGPPGPRGGYGTENGGVPPGWAPAGRWEALSGDGAACRPGNGPPDREPSGPWDAHRGGVQVWCPFQAGGVAFWDPAPPPPTSSTLIRAPGDHDHPSPSLCAPSDPDPSCRDGPKAGSAS